MSEPTIFQRIIEREIPCHRVYEDDHVLSFLDIMPLSRGHTLVIPKECKAFLHELSDESAAAIGRALPRVARAVLAATGAEHYNILQNNGASAHQAVFHVHFHIIPRYSKLVEVDGAQMAHGPGNRIWVGLQACGPPKWSRFCGRFESIGPCSRHAVSGRPWAQAGRRTRGG